MKPINFPEDATPLDPNETDGLKIKYISSREELDRWEQKNINDAITWLEKRRKGDILSERFAKTLHEKMFGKVWIWAGSFRRSDKNLGVDWQQINEQVRQLFNDINYWIEHKTYEPDEIGVRFHHRLVAIHPFPNGNGRHARLMTDVLMNDVLYEEPFTWGQGDLQHTGETRKNYINALKKADQYDYTALIAFYVHDSNTNGFRACGLKWLLKVLEHTSETCAK